MDATRAFDDTAPAREPGDPLYNGYVASGYTDEEIDRAIAAWFDIGLNGPYSEAMRVRMRRALAALNAKEE